MIAFAGAKGINLTTAEKFLSTEFWKPEHADLFSPKLTMEFPFAPPGWLQKLAVSEVKTHMEWLCATVKTWAWSNETLYSTNYPNIFIIKRDGAGDVHWAGMDGRFESRFITMLTIEEGKIVHIKDHFNTLNMMKAIGITYPTMEYEPLPIENFPQRPPVPYVGDDPEKLAQRTYATMKKFVAVDFWDVEDQINHHDIVHELPFAPPDMLPRYDSRQYDQLNEWICNHAFDWITYPGSVLYETDEPGVYFIESGGVGEADWLGKRGTYQQRELSFLRLEGGYAKEFHEYFNPLSKFNSGGVSVLTFPYLF